MRPSIVAISIACVLFAISSLSLAAEPDRGQKLYENHCTECHESIVHIRDDRRAKTIDDIRFQIARWRDVLSLPWTNAEIDDVLSYLNGRYYHYEAP